MVSDKLILLGKKRFAIYLDRNRPVLLIDEGYLTSVFEFEQGACEIDSSNLMISWFGCNTRESGIPEVNEHLSRV